MLKLSITLMERMHTTCERISRVSRFITTPATAIIITMEVGAVQAMLKLLKQLKLKMLKQQVPSEKLKSR